MSAYLLAFVEALAATLIGGFVGYRIGRATERRRAQWDMAQLKGEFERQRRRERIDAERTRPRA